MYWQVFQVACFHGEHFFGKDFGEVDRLYSFHKDLMEVRGLEIVERGTSQKFRLKTVGAILRRELDTTKQCFEPRPLLRFLLALVFKNCAMLSQI